MANSAPAAQTAAHATVRASFEMDYLVALPPGFDQSGHTSTTWPLLLFLHGMGERGADLEKVRRVGLPARIEAGQTYPFVVLSPLCPDDEWWNLAALEALIEHACTTYRIDRERIYLTGLSMGGFGVWALAARHPERYAAIAPICGGGDIKWAERLRDLPVWAFHGAEDQVVPLSRIQPLLNAIEAAGGAPRLTIYPDVGHDSWTATYANADLYRWLLSHRRSAP